MRTKKDPWIARLGSFLRIFEAMEPNEREIAFLYLAHRYRLMHGLTVYAAPPRKAESAAPKLPLEPGPDKPPSDAAENDLLHIPPMLRKT